MKLAQLLSLYHNFKLGGQPLQEITGLSIDSRQIDPLQVFIAIRGHSYDSHQNIAEVCARGAAGVVVEDDSDIPASYRGAVLKVPDTRMALAKLASRYYGDPDKNLYCVGVTGTNGKTSVTYLIESIFNEFGLQTGVMGTVNHHLGDKVWPSELTTPDAITMQKRLHEFSILGAKAVALEISSHAIDQGRAMGLNLSAVVFTNLSRDHLDYHKNMESYFETKAKLFSELYLQPTEGGNYAIINIDDEWGQKIPVASHSHRWTYGETKSDFQFQILETGFSGTRFRTHTPRGTVDVKTTLIGRHNVYNCVAAIAVGVAAGASLEVCAAGIEKFNGVPGRLQRVSGSEYKHVFVDYAHTDAAIRTVLSILQTIKKQKAQQRKLITVFGCGGDRDKGKRPLMGQAAVEGSDITIITSDNPRTEDPIKIIQEIMAGVPNDLLNSKVFVEMDRREAIRKSIDLAGPGDVVLIAGKGHEDYQIVGDKKYEFSDVRIAGEILSGL